MSEEEPKFDPAKELNAELWPKMSLAYLYKQELLLQSRIDFAERVANTAMFDQLKRGMTSLQAIIKFKSKGTDEPKVTIIDPHATIIDRTQR